MRIRSSILLDSDPSNDKPINDNGINTLVDCDPIHALTLETSHLIALKTLDSRVPGPQQIRVGLLDSALVYLLQITSTLTRMMVSIRLQACTLNMTITYLLLLIMVSGQLLMNNTGKSDSSRTPQGYDNGFDATTPHKHPRLLSLRLHILRLTRISRQLTGSSTGRHKFLGLMDSA